MLKIVVQTVVYVHAIHNLSILFFACCLSLLFNVKEPVALYGLLQLSVTLIFEPITLKISLLLCGRGDG